MWAPTQKIMNQARSTPRGSSFGICRQWSAAGASEVSLQQFLSAAKTVADCRYRHSQTDPNSSREGGSSGCIIAGEDPDAEEAIVAARKFPGLKGMDLAKLVTTRHYPMEPRLTWPPATSHLFEATLHHHVVAYDFGIKRNYPAALADRSARITVVPATAKADEIDRARQTACFFPTDLVIPSPAPTRSPRSRSFIDRPGPDVWYLPGPPVIGLSQRRQDREDEVRPSWGQPPGRELDSGRVLITSQNHGFAVAEDSLGDNIRPRIVIVRSAAARTRANRCPGVRFSRAPGGQPGAP